MLARTLVVFGLVATLGACSSARRGSGRDAGTVDTVQGGSDGTVGTDVGLDVVGSVDTVGSESDAEGRIGSDGGLTDTSGSDGGLTDTSGSDGGLTDTSGSDGGLTDTSGSDGGLTDTSGTADSVSDTSGTDGGGDTATGVDVSVPDVSGPDTVACVPACAGQACGPDGCGGECGVCADGSYCAGGACALLGPAPQTCDEAHGLVGCCANGGVFWFESGALQGGSASCADADCGWSVSDGFYSCGQSGADPSGTYPIDCFGANPAAETCPVCSCEGKVCGDDGCGGSCGGCGVGQKCGQSGQCVAADALECEPTTDCAATNKCECTTCVDDGQCTSDDDCICPDCLSDGFCSDPDNCSDDGVCDMYNEGCACADCAGHPLCS